MPTDVADPAAILNDGDLPGETPDEQPSVPPIELEGSGQLSLDVGGETPTICKAKLSNRGIKIPTGQYTKGQQIDLMIRVRCDAVKFTDKRDSETGTITETVREHGFSIIGLEKV